MFKHFGREVWYSVIGRLRRGQKEVAQYTFYRESKQHLTEAELALVHARLHSCRRTLVYDHATKKADKENHYDELVGDPCYRYTKDAKETFFKDPTLAFIFLEFVRFTGKRLRVKPAKRPVFNQILRAFSELAKQTLRASYSERPSLVMLAVKRGFIQETELIF